MYDLYLVGPFRFFRDAVSAFNLPALKTGFTVWFIPVFLGGIFLFLLVSANPLLERWISLMKPGNTASYVSPGRLLFWAMALSIVWPFIHVRWRGKREVAANLAEAVAPEQETRSDRIDFFGVTTILRSLILFNLLFAVQTVLDVAYLWGNAKLPDDISYASYAIEALSSHPHRVVGGRLRSRRNEAGRPGREVSRYPGRWSIS